MNTRTLIIATASMATLAFGAQAAPLATPAKPVTAPPAAAAPPTLSTALEDATPATPADAAAPPAAPKMTPPAPTAEPPVSAGVPAPAFRAGAKVTDSTGAQVGVIQSIAESSAGAMIVLQVDGKLVSVPQGSLAPFGEGVKSSQSKAEILAATPQP